MGCACCRDSTPARSPTSTTPSSVPTPVLPASSERQPQPFSPPSRRASASSTHGDSSQSQSLAATAETAGNNSNVSAPSAENGAVSSPSSAATAAPSAAAEQVREATTLQDGNARSTVNNSGGSMSRSTTDSSLSNSAAVTASPASPPDRLASTIQYHEEKREEGEELLQKQKRGPENAASAGHVPAVISRAAPASPAAAQPKNSVSDAVDSLFESAAAAAAAAASDAADKTPSTQCGSSETSLSSTGAVIGVTSSCGLSTRDSWDDDGDSISGGKFVESLSPENSAVANPSLSSSSGDNSSSQKLQRDAPSPTKLRGPDDSDTKKSSATLGSSSPSTAPSLRTGGAKMYSLLPGSRASESSISDENIGAVVARRTSAGGPSPSSSARLGQEAEQRAKDGGKTAENYRKDLYRHDGGRKSSVGDDNALLLEQRKSQGRRRHQQQQPIPGFVDDQSSNASPFRGLHTAAAAAAAAGGNNRGGRNSLSSSAVFSSESGSREGLGKVGFAIFANAAASIDSEGKPNPPPLQRHILEAHQEQLAKLTEQQRIRFLWVRRSSSSRDESKRNSFKDSWSEDFGQTAERKDDDDDGAVGDDGVADDQLEDAEQYASSTSRSQEEVVKFPPRKKKRHGQQHRLSTSSSSQSSRSLRLPASADLSIDPVPEVEWPASPDQSGGSSSSNK